MQEVQSMLDEIYSLSAFSKSLRHVVEIDSFGCRVAFRFIFDTCVLRVSAEVNFDSIIIQREPLGTAERLDESSKSVDHIAPWRDLIGKEFYWGWITTNQQGYSDGLLMSFEDIFPRILLYVAASNISVHEIIDR